MVTIATHSFFNQLLDKFEHWMIQAEFGSAYAPTQAPVQPTKHPTDE